jgi:serralysin
VTEAAAAGTDLLQLRGVSTNVAAATLVLGANIENLNAAATGTSLLNFTGNLLNNAMTGNAANNVLDGGAGTDTLVGGLGNDTYVVDNAGDVVTENVDEGIDTVQVAIATAGGTYVLGANIENATLTNAVAFNLTGNALDNVLVGNAAANVLSGGVGNDVLDGGAGIDTLIGGLGNDTYVLSDLLDTIIDSGGIDTIRTSLSVTLQNGMERVELIGLGDVSAIGNAADNTLIGNPGNNYLEGGAGVDILTGGAGGDGFFIAFNGADQSPDTVTDFKSGEDLLMLDLASFGINPQALGITSSGMVGADTFVQGAGARALDPNDYFIFDTAQQILYIDPDGSGPQLALVGVHFSGSGVVLTADDIYGGI